MAQEIERKFLITSNTFKKESFKEMKITQGFLSTIPERTVRVRVIENKGFITVKGIGNESGVSRYEWEKEIAVDDVLDLLKICEPGIIEKKRFNVVSGEHIFEVDEFYGDNKGLIIAEVELSSEDEIFEKPKWLGAEVTGDLRYYNATLMNNPYNKW